jgi:hypothetical protein
MRPVDKEQLRRAVARLTVDPLDPSEVERVVDEAAATLEALDMLDELDLSEVEPALTLVMPRRDS